MFWYNLSVPSSKVKHLTFEDGTNWLSLSSVRNYHSILCKIPEEHRSPFNELHVWRIPPA